MWLWLVTAGFAQSLEALDAAPPPSPIAMAWDEAPKASLRRTGGNGPDRMQYTLPSDPRTFGAAVAAAVHYEYVEGHLATVIAVFPTAYDAQRIVEDLTFAYGPATFWSEDVRVWRGQRVRLVWRRQEADLWVVTWSFLPRQGADVAPFDSAEPLPSAIPHKD